MKSASVAQCDSSQLTTVRIPEGSSERRRHVAASLSCHKQMLQNVGIGSIEQGQVG
jgi:hypothetical protein